MSLVGSPMSPDNQCPGDEPVSWSRAFRNPRPLAIGSASHYAQEHGLTLDFYTESSKRAAAHLISLKGDFQHAKNRKLTSYSHLAQCSIPAPGISDPWLDTEPSVQYFQQLLSALDDPCLQSVGILEPRHRVAKEARCEIPVLRSDNNLDLLGLVCDIYNRQAVPLAETSMPPIEPDASGDEGLHFPCWSDQLTKHFDNHLPKEVLQNGKASPQGEDAGFYGTADVGKPDRKAISGLIETEFTVYKQSRPSGAALSPPLLPSQFTYDAFIPDSEACIINCFSDTAALLEDDIKQVESRLVAEYDGEDTLHSELQTPPESSPEFPVPLKEGARISDFKVEVPLTGFVQRCQGDREDVVLKDALDSVTSLCGEASVTVNDVGKMADKASFLTAEIAVQVQDASERTRRQVEQERLSDPGSSRRVPVPVLDFTIPEPVWKKLGTAVSHFRSVGLFTQEIIGKRIKSDAREERKLRWRPLNGSSGKVSLTERIVVDSGKLEQLLDIPDDTEADDMKVKCLCSRRTLRFLSDPVDGDEEMALSPLAKQMLPSSPSPSPESPTKLKRTQQSPDREDLTAKKPRTKSKKTGSGGFGLLDGGGSDGVGGLLTSYLHIRAPEKAFPTKSAHFRQTGAAPAGTSPRPQDTIHPPWGNQAPKPQAQKLPTLFPEFDPRGTGSRYIVSAALGKTVIQQLDQLCPMAKLYTRDFSNLAKSTGASGTRGKESPLAHESNIALSSSTGVVATSLAQLRQKSLAGGGQTQLRQKMQTVAAIYDKLIVLISVPKAKWTSDDTRAYTDFVAFVDTLDLPIEPVLVGYGEDCLGKWIICLMNEYRHEGRRNEHLLVQEETSWETFFRLGGMNVYAAQVLAGALKAAHGSQGLARLLAMGSDERVSSFEAIIGARRPLVNLSRWAGQGRI